MQTLHSKPETSPFSVRLRILSQEEIQAEYMSHIKLNKKVINLQPQRTSGTGAAMDGPGNYNASGQ